MNSEITNRVVKEVERLARFAGIPTLARFAGIPTPKVVVLMVERLARFAGIKGA